MHRCIDVAVRRIVLHVQDIIHTVRDHPASSDKRQCKDKEEPRRIYPLKQTPSRILILRDRALSIPI